MGWECSCVLVEVKLVLLVRLVWNVDTELTEYRLNGQTSVGLNRFIDVPVYQDVLNWDLNATRADRT